jgi:hypothetical protein
MFIRFISVELHEDSQVAAGLFVAASQLLCRAELPDYEYEHLTELMGWFDENLPRPWRFSRSNRRARKNRAICWFRSSAQEHLRKAHEMTVILESNDVPIRMIKAERIGYVVYEDEFQVVAEPFADLYFLK